MEMKKCTDHQFQHLANFLHVIFTYCKKDIEILISGPVIENVIKNKSLNKERLYIYCNPGLQSLIAHLEKVFDKNFKLRKSYRISTSKNLSSNVPNHWNAEYESLESENIFMKITLYSEKTKKFVFDCDNLMLDKWGFVVNKRFPSDTLPKYNTSQSVFVLDSLRNIVRNKCNLILSHKNFKKLDTKELSIFNLINEQNKLIKRGKQINHGIITSNDTEKCSICYNKNDKQTTFLYILKCNHIFCSYCIDKHTCSNWLVQNNNCPICREKINFRII